MATTSNLERKNKWRGTTPNSGFAVRFAHSNASGTSQTRKTLAEMLDKTFLELDNAILT